MEYNFTYIQDMRCDINDMSYEFFSMSKRIDDLVSGNNGNMYSRLFHVVPVLYSFAFVCGSFVFINSLF